MKYLNERGIEIVKRGEPKEIVDDDDILSSVAGAWIGHKEAIRAVIQSRCDKLREKLIFTDEPYETVVTRQSLAELAGLLEDFELLHAEFENREKQKGGTQVTEEKGNGSEG